MKDGLAKGTENGLKRKLKDGLRSSALPLINDPAFFESETIKSAGLQFKLSNPIFVERLLWDYEMFCQLAALSENFVLKGGAASQVYLPSELQRASVDVDIATTHSRKEIEGFLDKIKAKFEKKTDHEVHFSWELRKPKGKFVIEDLNEYGVVFPSVLEKSSRVASGNWIQIDTIRYDEMPLRIKTLPNPSILGLAFKPLKVVTEGSLIADKLLTLADNTIGILAKKSGNYTAYLKQVYDLSHLTRIYLQHETTFNDIFYTLEKLAPLELKYRRLSGKSLTDVLKDIISSLDIKRLFDFGEAAQKLKDDLISFQGNYLNAAERQILPVWVARLLKLKLITSLILLHYEEKISAGKLSLTFRKVEELEKKVSTLQGAAVREITAELLKHLSYHAERKKIKNSPPVRVLYAAINTENMSRLFERFGIAGDS